MRQVIWLYRMALRDLWRDRDHLQQCHGCKPGKEPDWGLEVQPGRVDDADFEAWKAAHLARQERIARGEEPAPKMRAGSLSDLQEIANGR